MQGFAEKKKLEQQLLEEKKQPKLHSASLSGILEGPMALRESQKVEQHGRESFEKSVKVELEAIKGRKKRKARKRRERAKKKARRKKGRKRKG